MPRASKAKARRPKAQRERVVVAWACICRKGRLHALTHTQRQATEWLPELDGALFLCGPHRVVRLEGRVKVGGGR